MRRTFMVRKLLVASSLAVAFSVSALMLAGPADSRLADAAMKGDLNSVHALLKLSADVNGAQGDGMTALHWAAAKDNPEIAAALLAAGASAKAVTRIGGITPLWLASQNGDAPIVDML